ncbi:zinc finger and SCAN domain-containing protein 2 isoform X4 [Pleuronectes platessa]|uniref:zinc finger and SCAN domain-containing protein 2 isoform X4 n=1 Tax=Pleuronectes platessa TaxID=8262 RepID=UPI00232A4D5A|nr:zinc finger and SCAN domain-containing protein 2 isoform X4 [Pleuronectes platessa]
MFTIGCITTFKMMSSVQYLRAFISERLTAAAEEIFTVFEKTIIQYEEEVDRQRRLLETVLKPEIKLHRIELPQQHVCKEEEVLTDQQLCPQERNSSLDQEEQESPQIKEEQEEMCTSQEGEQLVLKQETETCMLTPHCEESDLREPEGDHQLLSHNSPVAESQDQNRRKHLDSESTGNEEPNPQKSFHENKNHSNNVYNSHKSEITSNTHTGKRSFQCDTCGKTFVHKYNLKIRLRTHTGEKPYLCKICTKGFVKSGDLKVHVRIHTGEKPYSCQICGKRFGRSDDLKVHMRIHTGGKPYSCQKCGKCFVSSCNLKVHVGFHTGEKPYSCKISQKRSVKNGDLKGQKRVHTGEKPYFCQTCGKCFLGSCSLKVHMSSHTDEKQFSCQRCALNVHMRTRTGEEPATRDKSFS